MERDMKIKVGCLEESDTYFLFCSSGGPSSFHSSASFCIPRFSSLLRPSTVVVKASGYVARYAGVPGAAFDCLDASLDTLSAYCTLTASLRQYIYLVVFVPSMWLWDFGRTCHGLDGFDRARRLVGVVDPRQCFLLAVAPVGLMCKTNTGMQTFLRSSGRAWLSSLAFAMISFTVAARILALASLLLASL